MTPEPASPQPGVHALFAERAADLTRSIDRHLMASRAMIDQLAVLRKSLAQRLFTVGIGHRTFKTSPIGDIPAEWDVTSLGEIARLASGRAKPKDASYLRSPSHAVPIYGGKGILGFSGSSLRGGDTIVVGRVGAHCGAVHFVSDEACWITDSALFVYETRPEVDLRFLYHSLCQRNLASLRNMGRQPLISLSTIYPVLLPLPPLAEQREICGVLSCVETLMEAERKVVGQATTLRSLLFADARSGNPSD